MKTFRTQAAPIFISLFFLTLTARAVYTYLSPDDFMAIYQSWTMPLGRLVKANILFFLPSDSSRPLAFLWYRWIYQAVGLHPVPFKVINLAILVASIFLTYAVARRLAKSRTAGALAALLLCYHGEAIYLYFDTGYVADVLCYFFYFSAVILYLRRRVEGRFPSWSELAACCALYICALNSKELAVTLPVLLLLYELLYHPPKELLSWRRGIGILATGAVTLAFLIGRVFASNSLMNINPMYRPSFTWTQFMRTSLDFTSHLFLRPNSFTPAMLFALWLALLAIAWLTRSRALMFAWLFLMLSPLPVAFISPRGVSQYYIPRFGWSLYAGVLINLGWNVILRRIPSRHSFRTRTLSSAALVIVLAGISYPLWRIYDPWKPASVLAAGEVNRYMVRQLHRLAPKLPPHARLLFLDDPFAADWWNVTFVVQLSYHDRDIAIDRVKTMLSPPSPLQLAAYDHVFDYRGGHFRELRAPWIRGPMPTVAIEDGHLQLFHSDWIPVNRDDPAHPGERLITKAMDLGETRPPLLPGQRFPGDPLAPVVSQIQVRVNGIPAAIDVKVGWPGETAFYRLDIRLPENAPRGLVWIDLSANGITGPAVEFPVK